MEILRYLTSYFILVIGCDIVLFTAYMVKLKKTLVYQLVFTDLIEFNL